MPLYYVLFFPRGDLGWNWALTFQDPESRRKNLRITQCAFYQYMLHIHQTIPYLLFYGKRLFQKYLVDAWAAYDQNKCDWIRSHQKNLRADLYNGIADTRRGASAAILARQKPAVYTIRSRAID